MRPKVEGVADVILSAARSKPFGFSGGLRKEEQQNPCPYLSQAKMERVLIVNLIKWRRDRDSNPRQRFTPCTRLAGERLQPTRPSLRKSCYQLPAISSQLKAKNNNGQRRYLGGFVLKAECFLVAEGVGFEPTEPRSGLNGFQDRRLKPLGHPSGVRIAA